MKRAAAASPVPGARGGPDHVRQGRTHSALRTVKNSSVDKTSHLAALFLAGVARTMSGSTAGGPNERRENSS